MIISMGERKNLRISRSTIANILIHGCIPGRGGGPEDRRLDFFIAKLAAGVVDKHIVESGVLYVSEGGRSRRARPAISTNCM